jgi:hypothetical protein
MLESIAPVHTFIMAAPNASVLTLLALLPLIAWRMISRMRRLIGRQRLSRIRPWVSLVIFPLLLALLSLAARAHPQRLWFLGLGVALGGALAVFGLKHTRFERTPQGLFYTPNAHLGIALSLLLVLRLGYRFVMLQMNGQDFDPQAMQLGASPLTMAIFGTLAGYYVTYAIGLLRWRAQVGRRSPAEH